MGKVSFAQVLKRNWVVVVAAGVIVHATASLGHGFSLEPHHHISTWLWVGVALSFAGGWWVAVKPERLQPQSPAMAWAFGVAVVVFLAFDGLDHQGGVLIRNGITAAAWILGVLGELTRQSLSRRRAATAAPS